MLLLMRLVVVILIMVGLVVLVIGVVAAMMLAVAVIIAALLRMTRHIGSDFYAVKLSAHALLQGLPA